MGKLTDILGNSGFNDIHKAWDSTSAADDFAPLPPGEYVAHVVGGELTTSRTNATLGYKLTFRVVTGPAESTDHAERQFWHDVWLTPAAMPMAKRDLGKLGFASLEQLETPLPPGIRCRVQLAKRKGDDGAEFNKVKRFDVLGIDPPETDPFAPDPPAPDEPEFDTNLVFPAETVEAQEETNHA